MVMLVCCAYQVRSIIAKRLLESKLTAPSLYVSVDVRLDQLNSLRKTLAEQVGGWGYRGGGLGGGDRHSCVLDPSLGGTYWQVF